MSAIANSENIFTVKPRFLNYRSDELGEVINPISPLALNELKTTTKLSYGNREAGFNQFSMKPLESRNNNDKSVNEVFAMGMNRTTTTTPSFFVQPLPSRYQILDPKPDDFDVVWTEENPRRKRQRQTYNETFTGSYDSTPGVLLSTTSRIGENLTYRNVSTDLRGSVPRIMAGSGSIFNQNLQSADTTIDPDRY